MASETSQFRVKREVAEDFRDAVKVRYGFKLGILRAELEQILKQRAEELYKEAGMIEQEKKASTSPDENADQKKSVEPAGPANTGRHGDAAPRTIEMMQDEIDCST